MLLKDQVNTAHQLLAGFDIPTIPLELVELQRCLNATEFPDYGEVSQIIGRNTLLSGEIVKVANQTQFLKAGSESVHTLREAVDVLGLKRLRNLVMGLSFKLQVEGEVFEDLISHSVDVANVATELSRSVAEVAPDEVYMTALFHNAGAIIMAMKFADYADYFYSSLTNYYGIRAKEAEQYQVYHGVFGLLVARAWQLDSVIAQVMLTHHQQDLSKITQDKVRTLVALIQIANALVSEVSFDVFTGSEIKTLLQAAQEELMLSDEVVNEVRRALIANDLS